MKAKREQDEGAKPAEVQVSAATKSLKSPNLITGKRRPKRSRSVKFAHPLAEQRLYDRTSSPNAETEMRPILSKLSASQQLEQLEPPLSLVAQLDLAAKKLNARPSLQSSPDMAPSSAAAATTTKTPDSWSALGPPTSQNIAAISSAKTIEQDNEQSLKNIRSLKSSKSVVSVGPRQQDPQAKKDKRGKI